MNEQVKQRWTKALRSGQYKQTKGYLHDDQGFCCLGVLTDLYLQEKDLGWIKYVSADGNTAYYYSSDDGEFSHELLADKVRCWAGLKDKNPRVITPFEGLGLITRLSAVNDAGRSFDEIAEAIERSL